MVDDAEMVQVISERMPTARREHVCGECQRTIAVGEQYEAICGKCDGSMVRYKTCRHCIAARAWLSRECGGWLFEGVLPDLQEHWDEDGIHTRELGRLIHGMRRKWRKRNGELMAVES